jgi:hypothetical protein
LAAGVKARDDRAAFKQAGWADIGQSDAIQLIAGGGAVRTGGRS